MRKYETIRNYFELVLFVQCFVNFRDGTQKMSKSWRLVSHLEEQVSLLYTSCSLNIHTLLSSKFSTCIVFGFLMNPIDFFNRVNVMLFDEVMF